MSLPVKRKPCLSSAAGQPATRRPDAGLPLGPGWLALLLAVWASPLGRTYVTAMWSVDRPSQWVGRGEELAVVRAGVEALGRGEGAVVWVEGEPGIGKSSLVAEALAGGAAGWDIGWGTAGKLTERLPLGVMLDCLQVRSNSPDPRRAQAAELLHGRRQGLFADGDASDTGIEVLVGLVDELCAAAPIVLILDDLQWAGMASNTAS